MAPQFLIDQNRHKETDTELNHGHKHHEFQRAPQGIQVVSRAGTFEEELVVVIKSDPRNG